MASFSSYSDLIYAAFIDPLRSVMIIDDDRFLLDMYTLKFKECGCTVEAISDPKAALEKIRGGQVPNIILLDVVMPEMNGFEFLEALESLEDVQNVYSNIV